MPPEINSASNQPYISPTFSIDPTQKRKLWIKRIIIVLFVIIVIVVSLKIFLPNNNPDNIASRFINDIAADKASQSYALTTPSFQSETSASDWAATVKTLSSVYSSKPKLTSPIVSYNDTELLKAGFSVSGQGEEFNLSVSMKYSDNHWRVYNFTAILVN
jgi:hypothetical protein